MLVKGLSSDQFIEQLTTFDEPINLSELFLLLYKIKACIILVDLKQLDYVWVVKLPQSLYFVLKHDLLLLRHPRLVYYLYSPVFFGVLASTYSDFSIAT
jgi:hypothetical protein